MDDWVDPRQPYRGRKSLYREKYNAIGKSSLAAIERIVTSKALDARALRSAGTDVAL
jgi:hypothetical protein